MKSLHRLALCMAAAAALMVAPAFASSGPTDLRTPDPMAMTAVAAGETVAPAAAHNVCVFAIVEDVANCTIGLAAVSGSCPAIVARVIQAMGPEAVGSTGFVLSCTMPPAPPD